MYAAIDHNTLNRLQGLEISTYMTIKKFADWTSNKAKVGIRRIAEEMGVSKNTALKYINKLVDKKLLIKHTSYNSTKKEYDTNTYIFVEVVQKKNKSSAEDNTKLNMSEMNVVKIKEELEKLYSKEILNKALIAFKKAFNNNTNIIDAKAYINAICLNLKAQMELIKDIKDVKKESKQGKRPSMPPHTKSSKNKFHNFKQRTDSMSSEELEKLVRRKR